MKTQLPLMTLRRAVRVRGHLEVRAQLGDCEREVSKPHWLGSEAYGGGSVVA